MSRRRRKESGESSDQYLWYLVKFEDEITWAFPSKHIRDSPLGKQARWPSDGKWYPVAILATGGKSDIMSKKKMVYATENPPMEAAPPPQKDRATPGNGAISLDTPQTTCASNAGFPPAGSLAGTNGADELASVESASQVPVTDALPAPAEDNDGTPAAALVLAPIEDAGSSSPVSSAAPSGQQRSAATFANTTDPSTADAGLISISCTTPGHLEATSLAPVCATPSPTGAVESASQVPVTDALPAPAEDNDGTPAAALVLAPIEDAESSSPVNSAAPSGQQRSAATFANTTDPSTADAGLISVSCTTPGHLEATSLAPVCATPSPTGAVESASQVPVTDALPAPAEDNDGTPAAALVLAPIEDAESSSPVNSAAPSGQQRSAATFANTTDSSTANAERISVISATPGNLEATSLVPVITTDHVSLETYSPASAKDFIQVFSSNDFEVTEEPFEDNGTIDDIVQYLATNLPLAQNWSIVGTEVDLSPLVKSSTAYTELVPCTLNSTDVETVGSDSDQELAKPSETKTDIVSNSERYLRPRTKSSLYAENEDPSSEVESGESSDEFKPSNISESSSSEEEDEEEEPETLETDKAAVKTKGVPKNSTVVMKKAPTQEESESTEEKIEKVVSSSANAVSVASLPGKRTWDKKYLCSFCLKSYPKLPRHWYNAHSDEPEVAKIMSLNPKSSERNTLIDVLRNRGTFQFNSSLIRNGAGVVLPKRRPSQSQNKSLEDYVPCQICLLLFSKSHIASHQRKCKLRRDCDSVDDDAPRRNRGIRASNLLMLPVGPATSSEFREKILGKMNGDEIYMAIRKDSLILLYGEHEFSRLKHETRYHRTVMDRCRELGRLLIAAKEIDSSATSLSDLIKASRYQLVKNAAKKIAGFHEETNSFEAPSLALKVGISLRKAANILKGEYLQDDVLRQNVPDIDDFLSVMDAKWSAEMSSKARRTLEEKKWNAPKRLPLAKDIQLLNKYLVARSDALLKILKKNNDTSVFSELTEITLVQLLTLNRRRVGEVQYMLLKEYEKAVSAEEDADVFQTLTEAEKELSKKLLRLVIKGKRGRGVPVLLTEKLKSAISLLIQKRSACGVSESNVYLFPSLTHSSGHYRAHDLLKKFATTAKCESPGNITSTKLRKHVATMTQLLNLRDHELDAVAKFMGHDIRIHRQYYRLADETMDLAKVSKLLLNMEKGNLQAMKGKSLDELELNDEEMSEEEETIDDPLPEDTVNIATGSSRCASVPNSSSPKPGQKRSTTSGSIVEALRSDSEDSCDSSEEPAKKKKKVTVKRRPWSEEQSRLLRDHFANFVSSLMVPKQCDINAFLKKHPTIFADRTWRNVKDYVYNLIKDRKKKMLANTNLK